MGQILTGRSNERMSDPTMRGLSGPYSEDMSMGRVDAFHYESGLHVLGLYLRDDMKTLSGSCLVRSGTRRAKASGSEGHQTAHRSREQETRMIGLRSIDSGSTRFGRLRVASSTALLALRGD